MMEQNTTNKPLRRVGTLTLGVCLIAAGTLFLLMMGGCFGVSTLMLLAQMLGRGCTIHL